MGLREINAARTREMIVDGAMELFATTGFDETPMEEVAKKVGIGTSTLYRYFPTKESLVASLLGDATLMGDALRALPNDQPLSQALGTVVATFMEFVSANPERGEQFAHLVQENPRLTRTILEWLDEVDASLRAAIAERLDRSSDDIGVAAASWMVIFVLKRTADVGYVGDETLVDITRELASIELTIPRLA